jgi:hypothetical protein
MLSHIKSLLLPSAEALFIPVPAYRQAGTGRGFQVRLLIKWMVPLIIIWEDFKKEWR